MGELEECRVEGAGFRTGGLRVGLTGRRSVVTGELLYDRYRATGTGYLWIVQGRKNEARGRRALAGPRAMRVGRAPAR